MSPTTKQDRYCALVRSLGNRIHSRLTLACFDTHAVSVACETLEIDYRAIDWFRNPKTAGGRIPDQMFLWDVLERFWASTNPREVEMATGVSCDEILSWVRKVDEDGNNL